MKLRHGVLLATIVILGRSAPGGCGSRCDASSARLRIHWRTLHELPVAQAPPAERKQWSDEPMMVYIPSEDPKDSITRKLKEVVFADERVGIGAKFFDTIKVSASDALADALLRKHGRSTPRIVLLRCDYTEHTVLEKRQISASRLVKAMRALVGEQFVEDFDKTVRAYSLLLDELDRIEARKEAIEEKWERLDAKPSPARVRKLEEEEAANDAAMDAWELREEKLLAFHLREAESIRVDISR